MRRVMQLRRSRSGPRAPSPASARDVAAQRDAARSSAALKPPEPAAPHDDWSCAICTEPMSDPAMGGGCAHHFCHDCYTEWAAHKPVCPVCRAPILRVARDPEFAAAIGAPSGGGGRASERTAPRRGGSIVPVAWPAGLTLSSGHSMFCYVRQVRARAY